MSHLPSIVTVVLAVAWTGGTVAAQTIPRGGPPASPEERRRLENANARLAVENTRIARTAERHRVSAETLRRAVANALETNPRIGDAELARLVEALAEDAAQLQTIFNDQEARVAAIADAQQRERAEAALLAAEAAFADGRFAEARRQMAVGRNLSRSLLQTERGRLQEALARWQYYVEGEARLAILDGDHRGAAFLYRGARQEPDLPLSLRWRFSMNEAAALTQAGELLGDNEALREAIQILQEDALALTSRSDSPMDWASTQNHLGASLQVLGEREPGLANLEQARNAYEAALSERTMQRSAFGWVETNNNLGQVLQILYERGGNPELLRLAGEAHARAAATASRNEHPLQWAQTQANLGNFAMNTFDATGDPARLHEAEASFERALGVLSRADQPWDWAAATAGQALAQRELARRSFDAIGMREAATRLEEAALAFGSIGAQLDRGRALHNLGYALIELAEIENNHVRLAQAERAFLAAAADRPRDRVPLQWASSRHGFADAMFRRGVREENDAHLAAAASSYQEALGVWTPAHSPDDWAAATLDRASALIILASRRGDHAALDEIERELQAARPELQRLGREELEEFYAGLHDRIDQERTRITRRDR